MQAAVVCKGALHLSLADGGSPCAGRLELASSIAKGSFHDDAIDSNVAQVLCWQLDCGSAVSVKTGAYFGETIGPFWIVPVHCNGNESFIWQCNSDLSFSIDSVNYPQKSKFVGVVCSDHRAPRLVDGEDSCSGRVEVQFGETWGTLCDTHWDMHDASVVCKQLQCGVAVATPGGAHFGEGKGPMWEEQFDCWGNESILFDCPVSRKDHSCTHGSHAAVTCSGKDGPQLVGGGSRCSGRVEILHGGLLGAVCDEYLDLQDADVICRHLHCGAATSTPKGFHFGEGTGRAWKDSFHCRGNESRLGDCMVSWDQRVCGHGSDASIICAEEDWLLRLRGGESRCDGSVEVFLNSTWGRVSDTEWDLQDASVVCRHLNCGLAIEAYNPSKYAPGNGPVLLSQIECKGNESSLQGCHFSQSNESANSSVSVGVLCTEHLQVRLAGSGSQCAGRVEMYHRGSWGTVCDGSWDLPDADVACRQLGCGPAVQAPVSAAFGEGSGPVWLNDVKCLGNESALWECPSAKRGEQNCRHKKDAGVVCSEFKDLRLVSAEFDCAGRLEIFYNGTWGSVCSNKMSSTTVNMICQQLGCGGKGTLQYINQFGAGSGPKWLDEVDCHGFESVLWQCSSLPWGQNTCQDSEVAGIECLGHTRKPAVTTISKERVCAEGQVRLVGADSPCSGRVELCYSGSWGTVCDDSWDLNDAHVVCTQLLCGSAVTATQEARFGEGNGTIWLDDVNCRGTEMFLLGCRSSTPGLHNCEHNEDAGVICSGAVQSSEAQPAGWLQAFIVTCLILGIPLCAVSAALLITTCRYRKRKGPGSSEGYDPVYEEIDQRLHMKRLGHSAELPESRCEDVGSDTEEVEDVPQEKAAEYDDIEENDYVSETEDSAELPESRCEDVGSDTEKVEDVPQEKDAEYDDIEENDYVNETEDSAELPDAGYDDVGHDTHTARDGQLDPDADYDDIEENDYINLFENSAGSLYDDTGIYLEQETLVRGN
ncbi:antigen WC1.1-like isoform X1 [Acipenser ruthenus]|uniref:antigen WC1.1-like isoform X1 n=1 Tax=Acipenser ruthenus TaxID=7906 RepID=UPI0027424CCE|nr:antigen WC1.1-like isoform X1 [Acipenser ruthenus]